jgi:guanylate kinase
MKHSELVKLVRNYKPDDLATARLHNVELLMVVGPSGVGKTALMKASGFFEVIGDASRAPREGERNGVDYWFRSEKDMLKEVKAGNYLQIAVGSEDDIKGTHAENFPEEGMAIFGVVASSVPLFRSLPFAKTMTVVVVPPDYDVWLQRLHEHHLSHAQLEPRLVEAKDSYEFALHDDQAQFLLNDDLESAVRRLHQIAAGQEPDDERHARVIAEHMFHHMNQAYKKPLVS